MPVLSGFRPGGSRLVQPTDIKLKGLQIQRAEDEPTTTDAYVNWPDRWESWWKPQIDLAVDAQGANLVKWGSSILSVLDGAITQETHDAHMRQFIEYAATKRVLVYWCPHFYVEAGTQPGDDPETLAQIVHTAAVLSEYPHVVGMDMSNEVNFSGWDPTIWGEVRTAIKSVAPALPLSLSIVMLAGGNTSPDSGADFGDDRIYTRWGPYIDFWDFHPYYAGPGGAFDPAGGNAVPAQLDVFRASSYYKPWIIGECGAPLVFGEDAQTARIRALGVMSAEPDSMGSVAYSTQDCIPSGGDHGFYSNSGEEREWTTHEFQQWPGRR